MAKAHEAKETRVKTFEEYGEEIAALKERRAAAWREALPDGTDAMEPDAARMAALRAENSPAVLALTGEIAMLRAEQVAAHGDPTAEVEV